ncbi:hypothetical protein GCM10008018_58870 [Paenibacillus marchantiophytorum]|uniref:Resolvase/invertase-type recombinase catalytic domain-containing protein n=1 Tax=Paenibacillus marchantiophytorum TaxID=1619310 RepID=A0ABQ1FAK1_9BACL|nr:hypothetical protein GCM10008018_58870 [Paenibacillus marchantiophytorum]
MKPKLLTLRYVRASAKDQNTERQLVKTRELGIPDKYIFVDKASGKRILNVRSKGISRR